MVARSGIEPPTRRFSILAKLHPAALRSIQNNPLRQNDPSVGPAAFEPGRLQRVKALGNPMLNGSIPTYYTPGYEKRARALQAFFSNGTAETLRRLDTIDPEFSAWARHLDSMPRANSLPTQ